MTFVEGPPLSSLCFSLEQDMLQTPLLLKVNDIVVKAATPSQPLTGSSNGGIDNSNYDKFASEQQTKLRYCSALSSGDLTVIKTVVLSFPEIIEMKFKVLLHGVVFLLSFSSSCLNLFLAQYTPRSLES